MHYNRPVVVSIAGFDPSGGAGVLADVKTLEQLHCLGMAALTATTIQTEDLFVAVTWQSIDIIKAQLQPLLDRYEVQVVKIGIIEDYKVLHELVYWLLANNKQLRIVWDPVIAASAGFRLVRQLDRELLQDLLKHIYLLTPNITEARILAGREDEQEAAAWLAQQTNVLLKGGHAASNLGTDHLYINGQVISLLPDSSACYPKHGSGCILSAAIAGELAKGKPVEAACRSAKKYIEQILSSNPFLLAYHHVEQTSIHIAGQ